MAPSGLDYFRIMANSDRVIPYSSHFSYICIDCGMAIGPKHAGLSILKTVGPQEFTQNWAKKQKTFSGACGHVFTTMSSKIEFCKNDSTLNL